MSNKYKHGKYRISIADDKDIQNKVVSITDDKGNDALGGGGTSDYTDLENKPSINGVELSGNKTSNDIGVYSKPEGGIPESDLSADVQSQLNKHFKGWYESLDDLKAAHTATQGDSANVKDDGATTWSIYVFDATATTDNNWADSGTDADTSNVQTFASGEEVNEVHIVNDMTTGGVDDVLSAEQGKILNQQSIYDVSVHNPTAGPNSDGKFASLSALLSDSNINTLIPTAVRCGGMTIRFVQSSDNKYVQFRYMPSDAATASTFTNTANWQGVDDVPTAGSANLVSSGGVYNNVNGVTAQPLEFTPGQGLYANGRTYNNTTASITDFIAVNEGDIITFKGKGENTYGAVAGYNTSKVFVSNLIAHTGAILDTSATVPEGIAYVRCSGRNHTYAADTPDPESSLVVLDPYIRTSKAVSIVVQKLSDAAKEQARSNIDAAISYIEENGNLRTDIDGYYRNNLTITKASGWKMSEDISINVGDKIIAGTTVVASYGTAVNVFKNAALEPVAIADLDSSGSITITQEMIDAGYRYLVISFRPENSKTIVIRRSLVKIVNDLNSSPSLKQIKIFKQAADTFKLFIDSNSGDTLCYIFKKEYKVWDSLPYTDGDGITQTATNVVSADYWNNDYICVRDGESNLSSTYILQGNTNFIYYTVGATYHVGALHGCEVAEYRQFFVDGENLDIDGMAVGEMITGSSFRYVQRSKCYASAGTSNYYANTYPQLDTSGNPIVNCVHSMDCLFEVNNRVTIDNSLLIMRDNLKFVQCHGAMLESNYGKFSHVSVNNAEDTINAVSDAGVFTAEGGSTITLNNTPDVLGTRVCMYGKGFFVKQEIVPFDPSMVSKCNIMPTAYDNRLKLYFMPVGTTTPGSVVAAETFNTGDSIKVRTIREIECHMDEE